MVRFYFAPWLKEQLGAEWINVIACQPDTLSLRFPDAAPLRVFHGLPNNPWVAITPLSSSSDIKAWLQDTSEETVICAHSHIPLERQIERWHVFNPGSVGIPLDGLPRASYMIIDGDHTGWTLAAHRRVSFEHKPIYDAFDKQRFVQRCGVAAMLLAQEFQTARLWLWPFLQWKQRHHPGQAESVELFDQFMRLDDISSYRPAEYRDLTPDLFRDSIVIT